VEIIITSKLGIGMLLHDTVGFKKESAKKKNKKR
jgi:hypothetical protein